MLQYLYCALSTLSAHQGCFVLPPHENLFLKYVLIGLNFYQTAKISFVDRKNAVLGSSKLEL